jgi:hypothetical protein
MPINERAWSVWCLLESRWTYGAMGGVLGWAGWPEAVQLLLHGYGVRGQELLAETERLKMFENAQMEIEVQKALLKKAKDAMKAPEGTERVLGADLEDFFTDALVEE